MIIALSAAQNNLELACQGSPSDIPSFAPSSQSCSAYILCYEGQATLNNCPDGYLFEAVRQFCDYASNVDCTACGSFGLQKLSDPRNCQNYYKCSSGERSLFGCPAGTHFDKTTGDCNLIHLVDCGSRTTTSVPPISTPCP